MKKAQITVFVLLGVVLILGVAGTVYLVQTSETPDTEDDGGSLDEAITPITSQIRTCARTLTERRVKELSRQGGYTDEELQRMQTNLPQPHRNEGLDFYDDESVILPYWYHSQDSPDCSTCSVTTDFLPLTGQDSFQTKTESYVASNITSCVNNFQSFQDEYDIETGTPQVTVRFNEQDTRTQVKWPITATSLTTEEAFTVDDVTATSDLPLRRLYQAATDTTKTMAEQGVLEEFMLNILSYNSFEEEIPPMHEGNILGRDTGIWTIPDIKEEVRQDMTNYATLIEVLGPDDPLPGYNAWDTAQFANDVLAVSTDELLNDYQVKTAFQPNWPITLRVNGNDDPVVSTNSYSLGISFFSFAFTDKDFQYDVSYPLSVTVTDDDALNGEGLQMRFAVEGNIRDSKSYGNRVTRSSQEGGQADDVSLAGLGSNDVTVSFDGPTPQTGSLEMRCAGTTIPAEDQNPDTGQIETTLPSCGFGTATLTYQTSGIQVEEKNVSIQQDGTNTFTLSTGKPRQATLQLERYQVANPARLNELSVGLTAQDLQSNGQSYPSSAGLSDSSTINPDELDNIEYYPTQTPRPPQENTNLTVILTQLDGDYATSATLSSTGSLETTVDVFPGDYDIEVYAEKTLDKPIKTEDQEICPETLGVEHSCDTINSTWIPDKPGEPNAQAVLRCVKETTDNDEYESFMETVTDTEEALDIAELATSQYDIKNCLDESAAETKASLMTGYYSTKNVTNVTISQSGEATVTVPYFSYQPEQIKYTRDALIMSSILELPAQTQSSIQPRINS